MQFVIWLKNTYGFSTLFWGWGALIVSYAVFHAAERLFPVEPNQPYGSLGFNMLVTILFSILAPLAAYFPGYLSGALVQHLGGPWFAFDLRTILDGHNAFVRAILLVPVGLIPIVIYDFFYYWHHRMQHTLPWMWEQHKLHHSDEHMNVTTQLRHHWTEILVRVPIIAFPMSLLLNITPAETGFVGFLINYFGLFIHTNVRLRLGPIGYILCGPQAHRIHHSRETQHFNKNFAAYFFGWDLLFGTSWIPGPNEFPKTGVAGEPGKDTVANILLGPIPKWVEGFRKTDAATAARNS